MDNFYIHTLLEKSLKHAIRSIKKNNNKIKSHFVSKFCILFYKMYGSVANSPQFNINSTNQLRCRFAAYRIFDSVVLSSAFKLKCLM